MRNIPDKNSYFDEDKEKRNTFKSVEDIASMGINKNMVYRAESRRRKKKRSKYVSR